MKQIETPRSPDPIMRRPRADREEKRVTRGSHTPGLGNIDQETLPSQTPIREVSQNFSSISASASGRGSARPTAAVSIGTTCSGASATR
ncbi:hypothetical protein Maq22A_1p37650 (plasmid) [Methylobacterium aquaticum]|uniref:Uncharacterized protein n=1 Tax=Methylobacterium aquaticum TaxID=270351 RepID=A0A0C6FRP5_9HYPH|nr:hypothetical protein Maq22A_1p37650 [Methylobacterium aquaticum]